MQTKDEGIAKLGKEWNTLIKSLMEAKKAWDGVSEVLKMKKDLSPLGYKGQKVLTLVNSKAKFDVMLPRFCDTWRARGGLEDFLIEEVVLLEEEKPKEKEKGNGRGK